MNTTTKHRARDRMMLRERAAGASLQQLATRHHMSIEGARVVVMRQGQREIDALVARLEANRDSGDLEVLLLPAGDDLQLGLAYAKWVLSQLADRGITTRVHQRAVDSGIALGLELETTDRLEEA